MKDYYVWMPITGYELYLVSAEDKEQAIDMVESGDVDSIETWYDWDTAWEIDCLEKEG